MYNLLSISGTPRSVPVFKAVNLTISSKQTNCFRLDRPITSPLGQALTAVVDGQIPKNLCSGEHQQYVI